jgi:hypothetical protein
LIINIFLKTDTTRIDLLGYDICKMSISDKKIDPVDLQRLEERKFMHDLAGPVGAALLSVEVVLETAQDPIFTTLVPGLETVQKALIEVTRMLRARRETLIQASSQVEKK